MKQEEHYPPQPTAPENKTVVSVQDWIITYLLMMLPIINIVLLFIWAFSSDTPVSKKNWAKANLLFGAIGLALFAGLTVLFFLGVGLLPD